MRWPEREQAAACAGSRTGADPGLRAERRAASAARGDGRRGNGALRLGTYRPIWAAPEVEISPALHYTIARQQVELSPEDAARLGIVNGEAVARVRRTARG